MGIPVRSMTGYAGVRSETSAGELTISLRTVNHRGLALHFHQSSDFAPFEPALRSLLKNGIRRGHVEIRISLARGVQAELPFYNRELLAHYIESHRRAGKEFGLDSQPDLNAILRFPGVMEGGRGAEALEPHFTTELLKAMEGCIDQLNCAREREGAELVKSVKSEIAHIIIQTSAMNEIRAGAPAAFHQRLTERLRELLNGAGIEDRRIAEEAAILADKSDVQEELTRIGIHSAELERILEDGGEAGKRLDFLLQEMNREANTVLSKTTGLGDTGVKMANLALATKANIEKIREQALNLE